MRQKGFTLLELTMVIAIALTMMAGSMWALNQHTNEARIQQSKMMLATLRTGVSAYHYRTGVYPSERELLVTNVSTTSTPFAICAALPAGTISEPVSGIATNTIATTSYNGGWAYNPASGKIHVNLDPARFPGDNPNLW